MLERSISSTIRWPRIYSKPFSYTISRSHYSYNGPGAFVHVNKEELWKARDFSHRGFTVGLGGPVGSGKTRLVLELCRYWQKQEAGGTDDDHSHSHDHGYNHTHFHEPPPLAVVTNDIFTQEDAEFLVKHHALPSERIKAVETGGCPHAAIREDVSANLTALEQLTAGLGASVPPLLLCESGGDNLAAQFSSELADLSVYIVDVAGGEKVPRKGGPGITQSDLLVINKTDLAEAVGADLDVMEREATMMRTNERTNTVGPTILAAVRHGQGVPEIGDYIRHAYERAVNL